MKQEVVDQSEHQQCNRHLAAIEDALYVIGGKWKLRITLTLLEGNKRFNEIQRALKNISARVLSHELKDLEMNGFIRRKVFADATPVMIEYEATEYSLTLQNVLKSLVEWGTMHREKIRADAIRNN